MKALGLRTCIYKVPDIKAATDWYAKAFETAPYFVEDFYVGFNIGGYELGLLPETTGKPGFANVETLWGVEDIQKSFDHLISVGATEKDAPYNVGGELMVATVLDPWGNCIGIIYNPHFALS